MQPSDSIHRPRIWPKLVAAAFVMVCLGVNFLPHHGPPHFRYTGSDPAREVWNLGWPLALFIYDPPTGFQVGPFAYVVLPFQMFVFAAVRVVVLALRRLHNPPIQRTGPEALS
jgi:hypothetical protein